MDEMTYKQKIERLESIVRRLEDGEGDLDESLNIFEEGIKLLQACKTELTSAEGRLRQLTLNEAETETDSIDD